MRSLDGVSEQELHNVADRGDLFAGCPVVGCTTQQWISPDDPDSSFSDFLSHISRDHPETDMRPEVLWPKIKYLEDDE